MYSTKGIEMKIQNRKTSSSVGTGKFMRALTWKQKQVNFWYICFKEKCWNFKKYIFLLQNSCKGFFGRFWAISKFIFFFFNPLRAKSLSEKPVFCL